ncbi:Uncharacterised protein [uncultured archaeon]|nr:Uncharacterised protein [uncultured archaeon]
MKQCANIVAKIVAKEYIKSSAAVGEEAEENESKKESTCTTCTPDQQIKSNCCG